MQNKSKFDLIVIPLKLLLICTVIALLVSGVNSFTRPVINKNEENATNSAITELFPDSTEIESIELTSASGEEDTDNNVTAAYKVLGASGEIMGFAIKCEPKGFKDVIKMMVALDSDSVIKGITILGHSETTGIGDKVTSPDFLARFAGKTGETEVDVISGATYSSKGVIAGADSAVAFVEKYMEKGASSNEQ